MRTKILAGMVMIIGVSLGIWMAFPSVVQSQSQAAKSIEADSVARARKQVQVLDDLYKTAVVSITGRYVSEQDEQPAALVAKDVFGAMDKKGYHKARLVDASGNPQNAENRASTPFEKKAIEAIQGGKPYIDQVAEVDGRKVLQAATIVPAVMPQCAKCHGVKEGELLGAIVYELPIE